MKRKIKFDISIGSYFPKSKFPKFPIVPEGGRMEQRTIEFETDNKKPYDDAMDALRAEIGDETFHVWYWDWLN